jgi:hypothetical protein
MPDFKKLADQVKAEREAAKAALAQQAETEQKAQEQIIRAGMERLRVEVLPLLENAKRDFADAGLDVSIVEETDGKVGSIRFQFISAPRPGAGYRFKSSPLFFQSDGTTVVLGMGSDPSDRSPRRELGRVPPASSIGDIIEAPLGEILKKYLDEWDFISRYARGAVAATQMHERDLIA